MILDNMASVAEEYVLLNCSSSILAPLQIQESLDSLRGEAACFSPLGFVPIISTNS